MDYRNMKGDTKFLLDKVREAVLKQGQEGDVSDDGILQKALRQQLRTLGVPASQYAQLNTYSEVRN